MRIALAAALLAAAPALAQRPAPAPRPLVHPARTVIDVTEDEDVVGEFVRPSGETILGHTRARHASLVRPRLNFLPELLRSADDR